MLIKLNGQTRFAGRSVAAFAKVEPGKYQGATHNGTQFKIEGGKKLGGSARDWFLDIAGETYTCTSVVDALELVNSNWS